MKKFINKLRNKYVMAAMGLLVAVSAFGGTSVFVFSASCPGTVPVRPVFNYWPLTYDSGAVCHDLPLIDSKDLSSSNSRDSRYSNSQSEHDAGINANVGDTVRVSIYFHNGATDEASYRSQTTAHNVTFGSTYSTSATTTHTVAGSISASNADTVTSTSDHQGGNITIHTAAPTTLQYISGSTQMCIQHQAAIERGADMSQTCGIDYQGQTKILINLPDGIANGSVGIGDLKSCFPYSGEVIYSVKIVPVSQPTNTTLSITKQVENLTSNSGFSSSVNAHKGDNVEYKVSVTNTGSVTAKNTKVTDPGTSGLTITNGLDNGSHTIGDLSVGQTSTFTYDAKVTTSSGTFINTATASASNAPSVSATAKVIVTVAGTPSLSITKQVEDLTTNGSYASSITANQNDQVQYKVSVKNSGTVTAHNVVVTDPGTSGLTITSGLNNGSYTIGDLTAGQTSTFTYQAKVTASSGSFTNTATATSSNTSSVQASATVNVNVVACTTLNTTEVVEDLTQNNTGYNSQVNANTGDTISFKLTISNPSSTVAAQNLTINQTLANGLNYVSGSATLNGNSYGNSFINTNGSLGTLNAGATDTFIFQATVASNVAGSTLNNSVVINSSCGTQNSNNTVVVNSNVTPTYGQLSINKLVRNLNYGNTFQKTVNAFPNDQVQYQITVTNTGTAVLNNVVVNDTLPAGLVFISSALGNGTYEGNGNVYLGTLNPGQQMIITINATVNGSVGQTIQNTASASANNAQTVYDSAMVYVSGVAGNQTNLTFSKTAFNNTKNVDATSVAADKEDYITYTLTTTNSGSTTANNFVVTDDLSGVLNYASVVNLNGGTMNGNTISWPAITIAPGSSVQEKVQVRVNFTLPSSYNNLQLINTYGNTVTVQINNPRVLGAAIVAPTTGPASEAAYALGFASLLTSLFYFFRNGKLAKKVLGSLPKIKVRIS